MRGRKHAPALVAFAVAAAAAGALAGVARALDGRSGAALLYELEALGVGVTAPWLAARALEDGEAGLAPEVARRAGVLAAGLGGAALVALGVALHGESPGVAAALLAQVIVALLGVTVGAVALAGKRSATGLATGLGAATVLLGLPYLSGDLVVALPRDLEALAVYWIVALAPSLALAGTCAGTEPFHSAVLYERFRPVGEGHVGFQHPSPWRALAVQGTLAAIAAAFALLRRLPRRAVSVAAAAVVVTVVLAPSPARAQNLTGGDGTGASDQGTLGIEIKLGYLYPFLDGNLEVKSSNHSPGTRLDLTKDLHLEAQYVLPTFDFQLGWKSVGRVWVDYFEMRYAGNFGGPGDQVFYRNVVIPQGETGVALYEFRTIGAHGAIAIPVLDFITLELIGTTRYAWFHSKVKAPRIYGTKDENHLEGLIPGLGPGFDFFVMDQVYAYGDFAWIDFSIPKKNPLIHYREGHLGVRFELMSHFHLGGEVVWLDIELENSRFNYKQSILGPRFWASADF